MNAELSARGRRTPNTTARPRIWFSSVTRWPTSFLRAMINERMACAESDFTCTGLKKPVRARCASPRIVAVGLVGRKRLQRLTGLPALDTDHRHTASGQAVMEHRGHAAGLEHDPPTGRRSGQRGFDVGGRGRYLHPAQDRPAPV